MNKILFLGLILGILFLVGCTVNESIDEDFFFIDKENNLCEIDSDCEYIWYTGECHTPEYVAKQQKEAQEQGRNIGEIPLREGVTCSCENYKCITYG